jgi:hypothetical protein
MPPFFPGYPHHHHHLPPAGWWGPWLPPTGSW